MGLFLTDMADILRDAGLDVKEITGWKTRGARVKLSTPDGGLVSVSGGVAHHTATPASRAGDYPTLSTILNGRSDVPGPLSQLGLGRSGLWYVVAAGRANHAGAVGDVRYSNPRAIGIEAEHPGHQYAWPAAQYESYVRGCAALGDAYNITWKGHKEVAIPAGRKPDPNFDMDKFRSDIRNVVPSSTVKPPQEVAAPGRVRNSHARRTYAPGEVEAIQRALAYAGYYHGDIDGDYGPVTADAVRAYQDAQRWPRLIPDGDWGPTTDAHFKWVKSLQVALNGWKSTKRSGLLRIDGDLGALTVRAIVAVQRDNKGGAYRGGIVDGVPGPVTCRMLGIPTHP